MPHLALCEMHTLFLGALLNLSSLSPRQHAAPIPSAIEACMLEPGNVGDRAGL